MKRAQFVITMASLILWANCGNQNPVVDPEAPTQSQRELNGLSSYQSLINEHNADVPGQLLVSGMPGLPV